MNRPTFTRGRAVCCISSSCKLPENALDKILLANSYELGESPIFNRQALRKACLIANLPLPVLSPADEWTSRLEWPTQADYRVTLRLLRPTDFVASEAVFGLE